MGKPKKGKREQKDIHSDDDNITGDLDKLNLAEKTDEESDILTHHKKMAKNKKKVQQENDHEEENEYDDGRKKKENKTVFSILGDEGDMADFQSDDDGGNDKFQDEKEDTNQIYQHSEHLPATNDTQTIGDTNKKKKKGKKTIKKYEGEDLDAILADIDTPTEQKGKKSKKSKKQFDSVENNLIDDSNVIVDNYAISETVIKYELGEDVAEDQKGSKKMKHECEMTADELTAMIEAKGVERIMTIDDLENEFEDKKKRKKSKKDQSVDEGQEKEGEGEGLIIKTTAQKKKDKKEKEKEKEREKKKKEKIKGDTGDRLKKQDFVIAERDASPDTTEQQDTGGDPAYATAQVEPEALKKKKKGKKDEKEKDKKPKNKQIAAIREHLRMLQEEEQRAIREAEERERKAEEAQRLKEEQKRLAEEKKQLKKQREKEKIERQKREGTYLTAKQKAEKRRAEQMLEMMRAQGMAIPDRDVAPKKKPVYSSRRRNKPQTPTEDSKTVTEEIMSEIAMQSEEVVVENVDEVVDDACDEEGDVKDAWDDDEEEMSETEDLTTTNATTTIITKDITPLEKQRSKSEGSESESEESSSEDSGEESDEDSSLSSEDDQAPLERARDKIQKRHEEAEKRRSVDNMRAPVVCVLGHVDTGKTKILDKLRRTNVQDGEAGGITQQIGATNVPKQAILDKTLMCKEFQKEKLKLPGMLIIDTPGHESFTNLRTRGSSLCDIAVLVVDIMHGLEPQTIESINLLRKGNTPFIVALNKVDRLYQWKSNPQSDIVNTIKKQLPHTKIEFDSRMKETVLQFAEQSLNVVLFNENKNAREYISMVPTSAHTGDGMGNLLALLCQLSQNMLTKRLTYSDELQATVMEVKTLPGLGTTTDVILVNGVLREGNTIVIAGTDGPIISQIRGLLLPQPMKELRVKNQYEHCKEVQAAQGVKVIGKDFEKAMAGLPFYVAHDEDEVLFYKEELKRALEDVLGSIKLSDRGVFVQASTIGSLEALLEFLKTSKIPYAGINIGPVHKKDIMKASVMLEHDAQYAVILAFDVKIEREAQEMADSLGVRLFSADIIYHLFDNFMTFRDELKKGKQEEYRHIAVFPCKIRVLPQFVFNSRDPIVAGCQIEAGMLKVGTPLCVPSKEFIDLGRVSSIEYNHKPVESARKGQEVCIKIESSSNDAPKMFGRHFDQSDLLVSKISRQSIDVMKEWFREELQKSDWQLIVELKKTFEII